MAAWTDQTITTVLGMVKTDLGILSSTKYDERLTQYIKAARDEIVRQGVSDLSDDVSDMQLAASFAGWLWRNRDKDAGLPIYLRKMLNNRIFSVKMRSN